MAIDITGAVLESDRLRLRAWRDGDLDAFYQYASVPGVGEMAGWPHHTNKEITRAVLNDFMEHKNVFAVCLNEDDRAIGSLGIHRSWTEGRSGYEGLKAVEIGYVLSKAHWGKGLMPEAVRLVLSYLFEDLNMDAVTVGHFPENTQSRRVIEKCGFVFAENGIFHAANLGKDIPEMRYIMRTNDFLS